MQSNAATPFNVQRNIQLTLSRNTSGIKATTPFKPLGFTSQTKKSVTISNRKEITSVAHIDNIMKKQRHNKKTIYESDSDKDSDKENDLGKNNPD